MKTFRFCCCFPHEYCKTQLKDFHFLYAHSYLHCRYLYANQDTDYFQCLVIFSVKFQKQDSTDTELIKLDCQCLCLFFFFLMTPCLSLTLRVIVISFLTLKLSISHQKIVIQIAIINSNCHCMVPIEEKLGHLLDFIAYQEDLSCPQETYCL